MTDTNERPTTILVVEDEQMVRQLVVLILEQKGYQVLGAADAREARDIWHEKKALIDLVLTDINLPEGTGGDLSREFRAMRPNIPIIFVSGHDEQTVLEAIDLMGDSEIITKPYTPKKLTEAIRRALHGKQLS